MTYSRNAFTRQDDERLARYIAVKIPEEADGGRTGIVIYKELEELVSLASIRVCVSLMRFNRERQEGNMNGSNGTLGKAGEGDI